MKLPQIDAYAFPITLPSSGATFKLRPYLVREEKLLLMAQESDNFKEQTDAVVQVIENCTNNLVDAKVIPYYDIEYLMLHLRVRSVGDIATPIYICNNKVNDDICGNKTTVRLALNDIKVSGIEESLKNTTIEYDKYSLKLKYPNIYNINDMMELVENSGKQKTLAIDLLTELFDTLTNKETNEVYNFTENTKEEKIEFLESQPPDVLHKLIQFFENMPKLSHTVSYTCDKCAFNHVIQLQGLRSFLEFWSNTIR